ncbi:CDP-alcohol phosphatidyltransferase family protein [Yunchengibacter salinarum]|uniref:CDP-alcohol phosphatidyltransferase family protein n=1 Tax=Yunchengibacter salinarum TaxID=3133399 RepID=UPI0035B57B83
MTQADPPLIRKVSIRTILPSAVTLMAFTAGLTAIRFAFQSKWELAVAAIVVAGILDGLDGTVARLLKSTSRFGAELDSLSDVVAFGVAPAVVLYLWGLQTLDRPGWAVSLIFAIAMALRLARFNAQLELEDAEEPRRRLGFLTGVPAPMGAGLLMMPLMADFALEDSLIFHHPWFVAPYGIGVAMLMVSTLPTFSLKAFRIPRALFAPFMLLIGATLAALFAQTWAVLFTIAVIYVLSLPLSWLAYRRRRNRRNRR